MNEPVIAWSQRPEPLSTLLPRARADLLSAIVALERWGVPVPAESRLRTAERLLLAENLLKTGRCTPEAIADLSASVLIALNFRDIASALPNDRVASVRRDLTEAVLGELHGPAKARRPMQLESQHLVAGALRLAGIDPIHPAFSAKRKSPLPDIFVERVGVKDALEVKRPEGRPGIAPRFRDAARQIASTRRYGTIVLDLTDALRDLVGDALTAEVKSIARTLDDVVWANSLTGFNKGYEDVCCVFVFARAASVQPTEHTPLLVVNHAAACSIFGTHEHLAVGEWLQSAFADGFGKTGFRAAAA